MRSRPIRQPYDTGTKNSSALPVAAPSTTWPEAAAKAWYLIQLFAATPEARDPRRQERIAKMLDDLARFQSK
jgi:hypothetical protein